MKEPKTKRSIRALLAFAALIVLFLVCGGGAILIMSHSRPDLTIPFWQFGQYMLISGLVNMGVYFGIWLQYRKLDFK